MAPKKNTASAKKKKKSKNTAVLLGGKFKLAKGLSLKVNIEDGFMHVMGCHGTGADDRLHMMGCGPAGGGRHK
jgi:hypothetical protein